MPADLSNHIIIYGTTVTDAAKLKAEPPAEIRLNSVDPAYRDEWVSSVMSAAPQYDMYRKLTQLSILQGLWTSHFIVGAPAEPTEIPGYVRLYTLNSSDELVSAFWSTLEHMGADYAVVAGWDIKHTLWPYLVNQGVKLGYRIPDTMRVALGRYPSIAALCDVSEIYVQGASPALRRRPALADGLRTWGIQPITQVVDPYPHQQDLQAPVHDRWVEATAAQVGNYLHGMREILSRYV